jgi:hypothetical protein
MLTNIDTLSLAVLANALKDFDVPVDESLEEGEVPPSRFKVQDCELYLLRACINLYVCGAAEDEENCNLSNKKYLVSFNGKESISPAT